MIGKAEDEEEHLTAYIAEFIDLGVTGSDVNSISRIGKISQPGLQLHTGQRNGQQSNKSRTIMIIFKSDQARNALYCKCVKLN